MPLNCYLQAPVTNRANWEMGIRRKDADAGCVGWYSEKDGDGDGNDEAAEEERRLKKTVYRREGR